MHCNLLKRRYGLDMSRASPPIPDLVDTALFFDLDGTLVEIAARPELVAISDDLRSLLAGAQKRVNGALAIVSGRSIADLDQLLAPLRLATAGIHGLELRPRADAEVLSVSGQVMPESVRARLDKLAAEHPELLLEYKGESAAVHYRQAPELAEQVHAVTSALLQELGQEFRLQPGKMVMELRPSQGDKGQAISTLMAQPPFAGRRPLFIGDDVTDEAGFTAVNELQGWSVFVGEPDWSSQAQYRLADVAAVGRWLKLIASAKELSTE